MDIRLCSYSTADLRRQLLPVKLVEADQSLFLRQAANAVVLITIWALATCQWGYDALQNSKRAQPGNIDTRRKEYESLAIPDEKPVSNTRKATG